MHKRDIISSLFFLAISILFIIGSLNHSFWNVYGPGPAFFPLLLSLLFLLLSLILFLSKALKPIRERIDGSDEAVAPSFADIRVVLSYLCFILLFFVLFDFLGYMISIFLFMAAALRFLGKKSKMISVAVPMLTSLFIFFVFVNLLGVTLPEGILSDFFYNLSTLLKNVR